MAVISLFLMVFKDQKMLFSKFPKNSSSPLRILGSSYERPLKLQKQFRSLRLVFFFLTLEKHKKSSLPYTSNLFPKIIFPNIFLPFTDSLPYGFPKIIFNSAPKEVSLQKKKTNLDFATGGKMGGSDFKENSNDSGTVNESDK